MAAEPNVPVINAALVTRVMAARGVSPGLTAAETLQAARSPRHKLAVTLLSCWDAAGQSLPAGGTDELDAHRHRIEGYRHVWEQLRAVAPSAYLLKGPSVADCYPAGTLRAAGDLDVVIRDAEPLLRAAALLARSGWQSAAFALMPGHGRHGNDYDLLVSMQRPSDTALSEPQEVELRTTDIATSMCYPPVRLRGADADPLAASMVALVAERWERPYTSRDLIDLAVIAWRMPERGWTLVRDGLDAASLWPQWREFRNLLAGVGLSVPAATPACRGTAGRRLRDRGRGLASWAHPVRAAGMLAVRTVDADRGRAADALARALHKQLGARRLLAAGVTLYGVPFDDARPSTGLALADCGGHLLARTPVGTFLLVACACPEEWLTEIGVGTCLSAQAR